MARIAFVLITFLLTSLSSAVQAKRVALVIGNSAYQHTAKLTNPRNDASDIGTALRAHGFEVLEGFDLDKAALDRKIRDFANSLQGAEAGVFFYAGHGLQVGGQNYLVPVDAQLSTASALDFEMVRLDLVHHTMERETPTNILFLDACRDNPLARNLARAMGTRSTDIGRGLAAVESGVGTLISFSTQPGNVALDGVGRNSPFAGALAKHISSSNDDLSAVLIAVRNDVMRDTQRKQVPWEHSALTGRFYFSGAPQSSQAAPAPPAQSDRSELQRAWEFIKETEDQGRLEEFIKRFGDTPYAAMARARLEELKRRRVVAALPELPSNTSKSSWGSPDVVRESLHRTILNRLQSRSFTSGPDAGRNIIETYRAYSHPKAMVVCIDWANTTPVQVSQSGMWAHASGGSGSCRGVTPQGCGRRVLRDCEERGKCETRGQRCLVVDINGRNAIALDRTWLAQFAR